MLIIPQRPYDHRDVICRIEKRKEKKFSQKFETKIKHKINQNQNIPCIRTF